ncbi:hypothetical protein [Halpernia sp.]|uniref:hypothetical protein n=1 Tax=Halpernia sp. TaxID=2782209 RepID=UPI003A93BEAD
MKKLFTLRGVSNTGKSTKVKLIAEWININYSAINHGIDFSKHDIIGVLQINKLKIGFVSAGDDLNQVKQIEKLLSLHKNDENNPGSDIDIIINTCRTKGAGRKYLENNFNHSKGWVSKNIFVERINPASTVLQAARDNRILDELKTWLTGVEKL